MAADGSTWFRVAPDRPRQFQMALGSQRAADGSKWLKMAPARPRWFQTGPDSSKRVPDGSG